MCTCPQVEIHLKLHYKKSFFAHPYVIKEEKKPVTEKVINCLEKVGIIKKVFMGNTSLALLMKGKHQNLNILHGFPCFDIMN